MDPAEKYLLYLSAREIKFAECEANIRLVLNETSESQPTCEALREAAGVAAFSSYALGYDRGVGRLYEEHRRGRLDLDRWLDRREAEHDALTNDGMVEQYRVVGEGDGYGWALSLIPPEERRRLTVNT